MFGIEFLPQEMESDKLKLQAMIEGSKAYLCKTVDFVIIPVNPRKCVSADTLLVASILRKDLSNINFVPTLSGSGYVGDAGKRRFHAQLLAIKYANFDTVAIIGGEDEGQDSIEMILMAREVVGDKLCIISGSGHIDSMKNRYKLEQKIKAGADRIITQPIFNTQDARIFLEEFEKLRGVGGRNTEAFIGVFGIFNKESALRINQANLGFNITQDYISLLSGDKIKIQNAYKQLWTDMQAIASEFQASLYLSTPKHNDLRAYGIFT